MPLRSAGARMELVMTLFKETAPAFQGDTCAEEGLQPPASRSKRNWCVPWVGTAQVASMLACVRAHVPMTPRLATATLPPLCRTSSPKLASVLHLPWYEKGMKNTSTSPRQPGYLSRWPWASCCYSVLLLM
ncbi:uncharacterized protein [Notamacropus eugenii]|uniref:uncharacterized protein isoform X3 n=1 Tax=Notamacropus eugenii TaxID=9315 RepID=UPI003B685017